MTTKARSVRHLAEYIAGRALLGTLALLPRRAGLACGRSTGRVFRLLSSRYRRVASRNLERAFGATIAPRERRLIARASFGHLGAICADAAYFHRLCRAPTGRIAVYEGEQHLKEAAALGRGVLVFSGHFGHWEMVALLQERLGVPMAMVVRPLENLYFDRFLTRLRSLSGNSILPKRNASRGVLRSLREGRSVAILIDQNVRGDAGVFVDFFGLPASTTPALATFAFRSRAPIVPVFSHPLPDGRLRISYREAIHPVRRGEFVDDIRALTRQCTALLEDEVRRHPECWLWMHDRWRTRPRSATPSRPAAGGTIPRDPPPDRLAAGEDGAAGAGSQ
jgi:KDO2-lipid IV(A) lauroyltransferase